LYNAVRNALIELRTEHRPVMLVGISMGAALSLRAVSDVPVDGLVILAPFWRLATIAWPLLPLLTCIFPFLKPFSLMNVNYQDKEVRKIFKRFFPRIDPDDPQTKTEMRKFKLPTGMFNEIRRAGAAAFQAASRVNIPLLTIQGLQDGLAQAKMTNELLKQYAGPVHYAEVHAGHELLDVMQPVWAEVRALVLEFAGRLEPVPIRIRSRR
jgi:pimeloyl-ACP methyl ester carboxylesterase